MAAVELDTASMWMLVLFVVVLGLLVGSFLTASSLPAFAHLNPLEHGSFAAGASHPLFGADHILAMVGVGLWAALLGGRSIWAAPGAFVAAMVAGFIAALMHIGLPFVEPVIAASIVVLGLLALVALQAQGFRRFRLAVNYLAEMPTLEIKKEEPEHKNEEGNKVTE